MVCIAFRLGLGLRVYSVVFVHSKDHIKRKRSAEQKYNWRQE